MKKVLFALMVGLATTFAFTSCSDSSDDEIGLSDVANSTFAPTSSAISEYNENNPSNQIQSYSVVFGATDYQLSLKQGGNTYSSTGNFKVENNKVILYNSSNEDYENYTFRGDGSKKIIDETFNIVLKKQ